MAGDAQGIKAGRAYVVLGADLSPLKKGLDAAARYLKVWGIAIAAGGASLSAGGGALGGGLLEATNALRQQSAELAHANRVTGIGVERLGELGYAAVQLGGDLEDVTTGMAHMAHFLQEVRDGSRSATDTLDQLGVSADELLNLDLESAYHRLGAATNGVANSTQRLIIARQILGRHGIGTMGVFGAGRERFNQLGVEGRRSGQVMSTADVATGVLLNRQWAQMLGSLKAIAIQIGVGMAPQWQFLLNLIKGGAELVLRFVKAGRDLVPWLDRLATGLTLGGAAFIGLGTGLGITSLLLRQFVPLLSMVYAPIAYVAGLLGTLASAAIGMAATVVGAAWGAATGLISAMVAGAASVVGAAVSMTVSLFGMIGPALGFVASMAIAAWGGLMTLAGAFVAAGASAAGGAGPIGIFKAFLLALGVIEGGATAGTGIFGTAVAVLTGEVTLAEAITGAWLIPLVALGIVFQALTAAILAPIAAIALFLGVLIPAALWVGLLAVAITAALLPALITLGAIGALVLAPMILGAVAAVILLATVIVVTLYGAWLLVKNAAIATWNAIVEAATAAWDWVKDTAAATWNYIADRSAALWAGIKDVAASTWGWISDTAKSIWTGITSAATSAWTTISSLFSNLGDIFGSIFDSIQVGNLTDALEVGWAALKLGWVQVTNYLQITWLEWRNVILDVAEELWLRLREMWHGGAFNLANIWRALGNMIQTSWTAVTTWLQARWADVVDFVSGGNTAGPLQAAAEQAQQAANEAQAAPEFDAAAERRQHEENRMRRAFELDEARRHGAGAEQGAQDELARARNDAGVNADYERNEQAIRREELERRLRGQPGGGPGAGAGAAAAGSFNAYAIAGMVGAGNAAERTANATQAALEVLRRILGAVQVNGAFGE